MNTSPDAIDKRSWSRQMLAVVGIFVIVALLIEYVAAPRWQRRLIDETVLDPQSPTMLYVRLEKLRQHQGLRVAVIGDSVILGRSLQEHGDPQWFEHSLVSALQRRFEQAYPDRDVLVMNLGINGALPCDLAALSRQLAAVKPDIVIADIGLRAFSDDFVKPKNQFSRNWMLSWALLEGEEFFRVPPIILENLTTFNTCPLPRERVDSIELKISDYAVNHSRAYALHNALQQDLLGSAPKPATIALRQRLQKWLTPPPPPSTDDDNPFGADSLLLMQAGNRFSSIKIDPQRPQEAALVELLERARQQNWALLLFYAREDPPQRKQILNDKLYTARRQALRELIAPHLDDRRRYNDGETHLESAYYLDFVHIDAVGNERLADTLWSDVQALVKRKSD